MSKLYSPLPFLLCLMWICALGASAGSDRDDSDSLVTVLESLLRNKAVYDIRDVKNKTQTPSYTRERTGRRKFKTEVRNVERNNIGGEKIVETDIRKDVNGENDLLLREIAAFLTLKRKSQRIWLNNDPSIRGTNTTSTSTSTTTPPPLPPSTTTPSTTPAPTTPTRTCRFVCFWGNCFHFCF